MSRPGMVPGSKSEGIKIMARKTTTPSVLDGVLTTDGTPSVPAQRLVKSQTVAARAARAKQDTPATPSVPAPAASPDEAALAAVLANPALVAMLRSVLGGDTQTPATPAPAPKRAPAARTPKGKGADPAMVRDAIASQILPGLRVIQFTSGSKGFHAGGKVITDDGSRYQVTANITLIGSKDNPRVQVKTSLADVKAALPRYIAGMSPKVFNSGKTGLYAGDKYTSEAGERYQVGITAVLLAK